MSRMQTGVNEEREVHVQNGWTMLVLLIAVLLVDIALVSTFEPPAKIGFGLLIPVLGILFFGFFSLQPNEARVLVLFGAYKGTVRKSGFHWGNPFYSNGQELGTLMMKPNKEQQGSAGPRRLGRNKISLRARTLN